MSKKKKVEAAKTAEELLAVAKETGYELSPAQLEEIAGGGQWPCPKDSCGPYTP